MKRFLFLSVLTSTLFEGYIAQNPESYFGNEGYSSWWKASGQSYDASEFLNNTDATAGVGVFWTVDRTNQKINLAVVCPIASGWCAFGIAEAGAMLGSDMVVFESQDNVLFDAHVLDDSSGGPIRDTCQNWKLVNSAVSGDSDGGGITLFEAQRSLDTGDAYDRALIDDSDPLVPPTRIIAAWGESPTVSFHGKNVARSSVRVFRKDNNNEEVAFRATMNDQAEGSFELLASNYAVPGNETYYAHFCFTYADLIAKGVPKDKELHVIGIEPVVDERAKEFVHHFVVSATIDPFENQTSPVPEAICSDNLTIIELAYVWAPGEGSFALPENVGGPLGSNGYKSFKVEIHYNNPELKTGIVDSSGIRIYWTSNKREYDMGILQLGDPFVALRSQVVGNGLSQHIFECPESCSTASVTTPITVFREYLHMHATGNRMSNEVIRDGVVVHTASVDFFDFHQQGNQPVQQGSFQILPGDAFRTQCYYNSDDEVWGLGSQNEMCISFLYYYPRQTVDVDFGTPFPFTCGVGLDFFEECITTYKNMSVASSRELNRLFGGSDAVCEDTSNNDQSTKSNNTTEGTSASTALFNSVIVWCTFLVTVLLITI